MQGPSQGSCHAQLGRNPRQNSPLIPQSILPWQPLPPYQAQTLFSPLTAGPSCCKSRSFPCLGSQFWGCLSAPARGCGDTETRIPLSLQVWEPLIPLGLTFGINEGRNTLPASGKAQADTSNHLGTGGSRGWWRGREMTPAGINPCSQAQPSTPQHMDELQ